MRDRDIRLLEVAWGELAEGVGGGFLETREAAAEYEAHGVGGAVALFGNAELGFFAFFGGGAGFEEVGAVDEHDDVGVLLDGAGFAEVGELRAALIALWGAGELAEDEDGNLQLFGEAFKGAGDAGDFFLAIAEAAARGDQLQIIDDEEREAFVALQAAGFGADFEDGDGAGVVDPDGGGGDGAEGFSHAAPVFAGEMAGAEFVGVDLGYGGDEALEERLLGHFEAEDGDGLAAADADVFGEVEGERGFSLRGARGEDQQLGGLQAGGQLVQLDIAGGDAGDAFAFAEDFFEALEIVADDVLDGDEAGADAVFGELEDGRFGVVEDGVGAVFALEGALLNIVGGVDEIAEDGFFFDDARVVLDVGDAGHAIGERGEVGGAAGGFEITAAVELFGEGDEVDGLLGFAEGDHLGEDATVLVEEEIFGLEIFYCGVEGVVVEDYGTKDGTLGVQVVGERLFEDGFGGHASFCVRFIFAYDNTDPFCRARLSLHGMRLPADFFQVARTIVWARPIPCLQRGRIVEGRMARVNWTEV